MYMSFASMMRNNRRRRRLIWKSNLIITSICIFLLFKCAIEWKKNVIVSNLVNGIFAMKSVQKLKDYSGWDHGILNETTTISASQGTDSTKSNLRSYCFIYCLKLVDVCPTGILIDLEKQMHKKMPTSWLMMPEDRKKTLVKGGTWMIIKHENEYQRSTIT